MLSQYVFASFQVFSSLNNLKHFPLNNVQPAWQVSMKNMAYSEKKKYLKKICAYT